MSTTETATLSPAEAFIKNINELLFDEDFEKAKALVEEEKALVKHALAEEPSNTALNIHYLNCLTLENLATRHTQFIGYDVVKYFDEAARANPDNLDLKLVQAEAQYRYGMQQSATTTFLWAAQKVRHDAEAGQRVKTLMEELKKNRPEKGWNERPNLQR